MNQIPKRLKKEPLIEAIWQVQFDCPGAGDVLPGVLYTALKARHPKLQLQRLPTADIPAPIAQIDPNLRFVAKVRMEEPGGRFLWQVGDRVVTLNCRKPYAGWSAFREAILALTQDIETSGLVPQPQRHSLRYIDLLTLEPAPDLSALKLAMKLGDYEIRRHHLQMRLEIPDDECTHVVQIATPAEARLPEGLQTGTVIDLETYVTASPTDWDGVRVQLETLHDRSKALFFQHLLTEGAIQSLEPEY